ncbi:hypothetical protein ANN_04182 [Periplaneta americana]|uniref:Uncharacterized protein n=1 Tax=Periplaneta americana TaxID=6978 RepID=A0ABQ8T9E6_PERAM|nr:hypothetical protein ANN_04182 [Periplaneta americana]
MVSLCEGGNKSPGSLQAIFKPPAWLSRLRSLPADLKLRLGAGSIPAWADYPVGFFPRFSPTVRIILKEKIKNIVSSDTNVVSVRESNANLSNSAKICGKQAVTSTEEETGVTRTGIQQVQQAQQNKSSMQANGNSGHQIGAIPKRVKELRSKSRLTRSRVTQAGDSSGSSDEGRGENKVKKQYDLGKWCGGEINREKRKLRPKK